MVLKLYIHPVSPFARAAWMTCEAIGVEVDIIFLDLLKGQQNEEWFLKINPRHCVPTMDDDGFVIWESRTIMRYVVDKYGKDDTLYPKDVKKRYNVNMGLDTELSYIFKAIREYFYPKFFNGKDPDEETIKAVNTVLSHINDIMLKTNKFVAGNCFSIADISICTSLQMLLLAGFHYQNFAKYEKVYELMEYFKSLPYYEKCNSEFNKIVIDKNNEYNTSSNAIPKLYLDPVSGACRSLWMVIEAVGLEVETVYIDLKNQKQHEEWFVNINPRHCLPTFIDNGSVMIESRAIMKYVADKYANVDFLYPKDIKKRSIVDMALDSDASYIYKAVGAYFYPKIMQGKEPDEEAIKGVHTVLSHLNDVMLKSTRYIVGDNISIADISICSSLQMLLLAGFEFENFSKYKKVYDLMNDYKNLPYYEKCNSSFEKIISSINIAK